jgi:hypothetical protein
MADTHDLDYEFRLAEGPAKLFKISLDPLTLNVLSDSRLSPPEWARLEFHQCQSCPLTPRHTAYCPICRNIAEIGKNDADFRNFAGIPDSTLRSVDPQNPTDTSPKI